MTDQINQGTSSGTPAATVPPAARVTPAKKRKSKKRVKRIISIVVVLALLIGAGWAIWYFLFRETTEEVEPLYDMAHYDSIRSMVEGSGNARAGESAAITLSASGTVQEVYVSVGDMVMEGQPLYSIFSTAAQEAVTAAREGVTSAEEGVVAARDGLEDAYKGVENAREAVADAQEVLGERQAELRELRTKLNDLTVTAPFTGKVISVENIPTGTVVSDTTTILTLANDKTLLLSLYFSYAYENSVYVGQTATVTIPSTMGTLTGRVQAVNMVSRVVPEGAKLFEVVIAVDNPGTLTADMTATASMNSGGVEITPYEDGVLKYFDVVSVTPKVSGPVVSFTARQYADVTAGQTLMVLGSDEVDKLIEAKQDEVEAARDAVEAAQDGVESALKGVENAQRAITNAEKALEEAVNKVAEAEKALEDLNASSPISGTVTSCTINPGDEVQSGNTVITISDTTQMVVEITVDDRNIGFVTPGMTVDLSEWNGNVYMGVVTNINMNPTSDNMGSGMTNYPVTLTVDNYDGALLAGQWLQYSFVASQSDDCIVVPIQSVKSTTDEEGNEVSVVFLQTDVRPDNAITMPEQMPGMAKTFPTEEEGYYAVPVVTGLSDTYNVEIISGLNDGDIVFTNYMSATGSSWGGGGIMIG